MLTYSNKPNWLNLLCQLEIIKCYLFKLLFDLGEPLATFLLLLWLLFNFIILLDYHVQVFNFELQIT